MLLPSSCPDSEQNGGKEILRLILLIVAFIHRHINAAVLVEDMLVEDNVVGH